MSTLDKATSWIIIEKSSGNPVLELFGKSLVDKINTSKYTAVPILEYLQEFNRQLKLSDNQNPKQ